MLDTHCGGKDKYSPFSHGADTRGDPQLKASKRDHYQREVHTAERIKEDNRAGDPDRFGSRTSR